MMEENTNDSKIVGLYPVCKSVSQLYGKDSEYAAAINAITTIGCIVTMPLVKIVE